VDKGACRHITSGVIILLFMFIYVNEAYSIDLYGSPKDKIFAYKPGTSPLSGSPMTKVREGYINDGGNIVLDTLSKQEKDELGIKEDNKMFVVIYQSPYTGESSFEPGEDDFGNQLKKNLVQLRYGCKRKYLCVEPFRSDCELLTPVDYEANKERDRAQFRHFYRDHKAIGLSDELIEDMWQEYMEKYPEQFQY